MTPHRSSGTSSAPGYRVATQPLLWILLLAALGTGLFLWSVDWGGSVAGQTRPAAADPAKDSRGPEIKEFITRYFRTWSDQDMKGYNACFLPDASIQYISDRGTLTTYTREVFIADQTEYHRTAQHRTTEVAESVDIRFEEKLARVVVYWKLTAGPRTEYGYDHFTLIKHEGGWRIVNLVFYSVPKRP